MYIQHGSDYTLYSSLPYNTRATKIPETVLTCAYERPSAVARSHAPHLDLGKIVSLSWFGYVSRGSGKKIIGAATVTCCSAYLSNFSCLVNDSRNWKDEHSDKSQIASLLCLRISMFYVQLGANTVSPRTDT